MNMEINKNIIYDKFLQIEMWGYRGKHLIESAWSKGIDEEIDKARIACKRIRHDLEELEILLKVKE